MKSAKSGRPPSREKIPFWTNHAATPMAAIAPTRLPQNPNGSPAAEIE